MESSWEELQREIREVAEQQLQEQLNIVEKYLKLHAASYGISKSNDRQECVEALMEVTCRDGDVLLPTPQPPVLIPQVKHAGQEEVRSNARPSTSSRRSELSEKISETFTTAQLDLTLWRRETLVKQYEKIAAARSIPLIGRGVLTPLLSWWLSLKEPERTGLLHRIVMSGWFKGITLIAIMVNLILAVIMTDRIARDPLTANVDDLGPIENGLLAFYTVELLLKLFVHRLFFFVNSEGLANITDLLIVITSFTTTVVSSNFIRSFRFARLARAARAARAIRLLVVFDDLKMLVDHLLACAVTMIWALVLIGFLLCLFSIFFVQMQAGYIVESTETDRAFLKDFKLYFSTVPTSMVSLFAATTGGEDWLRIHSIVSQAGEASDALFVFFIFLFNLAVYNIVMSSFMERVVKANIPSVEQKMQQLHDEEVIFAMGLYDILNRWDEEDKGVLYLHEFLQAFETNDKLRRFLKLYGMDIKYPKHFYEMVCESKGQEAGMTIEDFIDACCRLRSQASTLDVATLGYQMSDLAKHIHNSNKGHMRSMFLKAKSFSYSRMPEENGTNRSSLEHSMSQAFALAEDMKCHEEARGRRGQAGEVAAKIDSPARKAKRKLVPKARPPELR